MIYGLLGTNWKWYDHGTLRNHFSIPYRELDSSGEKMAYQGPKLTKLFQLRELR